MQEDKDTLLQDHKKATEQLSKLTSLLEKCRCANINRHYSLKSHNSALSNEDGFDLNNFYEKDAKSTKSTDSKKEKKNNAIFKTNEMTISTHIKPQLKRPNNIKSKINTFKKMLRMESLTKKIIKNDNNSGNYTNTNSTLNPLKTVKNNSGNIKNVNVNSEKTNKNSKYSKNESNCTSNDNNYTHSKNNSNKKRESKVKYSFDSKNKKAVKTTGLLNIVKYETMDSGSNLDDNNYEGTMENYQSQNTICTNIDEYDLDYPNLNNHKLDYEIEQYQFNYNNKKKKNFNYNNYNNATYKSNYSDYYSNCQSILGDDDNPKSPCSNKYNNQINYNNYNQLINYNNFNNFHNTNNSNMNSNNMLGDSVFGTNLSSNYYNRVKGKELKDYPNETDNTEKDILLEENFNTSQTRNRSFQYNTHNSTNKITNGNILSRLGENEYDLMEIINLPNSKDLKVYSKKVPYNNFNKTDSLVKKGEINENNDKKLNDKTIEKEIEYSYSYAQSNEMNLEIDCISPLQKNKSGDLYKPNLEEGKKHLQNIKCKKSIFSIYSDIGNDDDKSLCNITVGSINNDFNEDLKLQENKIIPIKNEKGINTINFFSTNNNVSCDDNNGYVNFGDCYDDEDFNPK